MKISVIIHKIKEKGIEGSIRAVLKRFCWKVNFCFFYIYRCLPMENYWIVMESEGDLSDNSYALFDYMMKNGYLQKYHVIWMVDDVKKAREKTFPNAEFCTKFPDTINIRWAKALAFMHWFIYDHCNLMSNLHKRRKQQIINLWHGTGYKAAKGAVDKSKVKTTEDFLTSLGPLSSKSLSNGLQVPFEKIVVTGSPRLDYFFQDNKKIRLKVNEKFKFDRYKKVIFWMPTFRQSQNKNISEDYLENSTGLPLFNTDEELTNFSCFLNRNNILLVLKIHHLQENIPIFKRKLINIMLLHDEDLHEMGIQLYQFIPLSDALVTDYSSVSVDYLLLNKPIIYTLDDYEEYAQSRGFCLDNAINYMKGYHVYDEKELEDSLIEILNGVDRYAQERETIAKEFHSYRDGNASARILKLAGII